MYASFFFIGGSFKIRNWPSAVLSFRLFHRSYIKLRLMWYWIYREWYGVWCTVYYYYISVLVFIVNANECTYLKFRFDVCIWYFKCRNNVHNETKGYGQNYSETGENTIWTICSSIKMAWHGVSFKKTFDISEIRSPFLILSQP